MSIVNKSELSIHNAHVVDNTVLYSWKLLGEFCYFATIEGKKVNCPALKSCYFPA